MQTYETMDFKLGNTTLNSLFDITIPYNYGDPVPECHSHAPIGTPFKQPLYNIINMISRGLKVQPTLEDSEKIYYFLVAYNKQAIEMNKSLGENVNPVATKAEEYFYKKIAYKVSKEVKENDMIQNNPFTKIIAPKHEIKTNVVSNKSIQSSFRKNNGKSVKIRLDNRRPEEHKLYEIFNSPNGSLIAPEGIYDETNDISRINKNMPDYLDEMDLRGE